MVDVVRTQRQSVPGCLWVGLDRPTRRIERPVEEQRLDPNMVVKPLEVPKIRRGSAHVDMQMRGAMRRDLQMMRGGDGGHPAPFGDSAASGDVGLQAIHRTGSAHPLEVGEVVSVLTGRHIRTHRFADLSEAVEII